MHTSPLRWYWGLPVVAVIWLVAVWAEQRSIEGDLKQRSEISFRQAGLGWAFTSVRGRDAQVIGEAYSNQERKLARRILANTWGIRRANDGSSLTAIEKDYIWTAAVEDDAVRLTGFYPNREIHRSVLVATRRIFPERQVADQMRPARGAPQNEVWLGAIHFGLAQLSRLQQGGRVNLRGTQIAVAGVASSVGAYRSIKGALYRSVPSGIVLINDKVEPPAVSPYLWSATFKDGQLVLEGLVPSDRDRDTLITIAKTAFKNSPIVDKMAIAGGAPVGWLNAASAVVREIAKLEQASANMSDLDLTVDGMAKKQITAEQVRAGLKSSIAATFKLKHRIRYREATIPTISPFVTTVASDGKRVSFSGHVPSKALAEKVIAAAGKQRPKLKLINAMSIAKGAPAGWQSCIMAGLTGLLKLDNGRVEITDRKLRVTGLTRDEAIAEALPKEVRAGANRACEETVALTVKLPPEPDLSWIAAHADKKLIMRGEVPNSAVEESLVKTAKKLFPDAEREIQLRVTPSTSKKWSRVAHMALEQLAKLRTGTAKIERQLLILTGEATDTAVATAVRQHLKTATAKGYRARADIEVKSAAMLWAEREAKRKADEAAAAAAKREEAAERERAERERADKAEAARAAADREAADKAEAARAAAARIKAEEAARIARRKTAEEEARLARLQEQGEQARQRCQSVLDEATLRGSISFPRGSDKLDSRSFPTLDRLVGLCQKLHIEISGHTDSSGSPSRNQELSERRARSVMSYLVAGGIPSSQLSAKGYGAAKPLVPNTTSQNRARNHRIEFRVKVN